MNGFDIFVVFTRLLPLQQIDLPANLMVYILEVLLLNLEYINLVDDVQDGALTIEDNIGELILCVLVSAMLCRQASNDRDILHVKLMIYGF